MTAQTELRPDIEIGNKPGSNELRREPGGTRKPHRVLWLIVLLIAMAVAGVVGVTVAANLTDPPAPDPGRLPGAERQRARRPRTRAPPNANDREDRVPTTAAQPPNANDREGRVSDNR